MDRNAKLGLILLIVVLGIILLIWLFRIYVGPEHMLFIGGMFFLVIILYIASKGVEKKVARKSSSERAIEVAQKWWEDRYPTEKVAPVRSSTVYWDEKHPMVYMIFEIVDNPGKGNMVWLAYSKDDDDIVDHDRDPSAAKRADPTHDAEPFRQKDKFKWFPHYGRRVGGVNIFGNVPRKAHFDVDEEK